MKLIQKLFVLSFVVIASQVRADVLLSPDDCHFVTCHVPDRGIVCSNADRAKRLSKKLEKRHISRCSWGYFVVCGEYNGKPMFVASAPVGAGAGLVFTELCAQGAKYIVRYGSNDAKPLGKSENYLVKIIDESDGLYGFNHQSGVDPDDWGKSVPASSKLVQVLERTAIAKQIAYEKRICHHLENYHALRFSNKYAPEKNKRIQEIIQKYESNPKPACYDMETAVLFRVAKDFGIHAATILQTFEKDGNKIDIQEVMKVEESIFFNYALDAVAGIE